MKMLIFVKWWWWCMLLDSKYLQWQDTIYNRSIIVQYRKNSNTVNSRLIEPALIRIIRLLEVKWCSPWICSLSVIQSFSFSKRFHFPLEPIVDWNNVSYLNFSYEEIIDFLQSKHFFSSKKHVSIFMAIYTLQEIYSKVQYFPSVQKIEAKRGSSILYQLEMGFNSHSSISILI